MCVFLFGGQPRHDFLRASDNVSTGGWQWHGYHVKDCIEAVCSGLYGLLPLCVGLIARLTEHLDRSEKSLLKGCLGTVKGWQSRNGSEISQLGPVKVFRIAQRMDPESIIWDYSSEGLVVVCCFG